MDGKESSSSSSSGPLETVTILYTETKVPTPEPEWSSSSTSDSSETSSSEASSKTLPVFEEVAIMKDMEKSFGYVPLKRAMSTSKGPKMQALEYFRTHHMFPFFTFLMSHLLAQSPEEPIPFLVSLVDRCIRYRDQDADPPLLFEDNHVGSVYTALDPMDDGTIDYEQYVNGMITLGLADFNLSPEGIVGKNRDVPKGVFIKEAKVALLKQLDVLVGKTKRQGSLLSAKADSSKGSSDFSGRKSVSSIVNRNSLNIMKDESFSIKHCTSSSISDHKEKLSIFGNSGILQ